MNVTAAPAFTPAVAGGEAAADAAPDAADSAPRAGLARWAGLLRSGVLAWPLVVLAAMVVLFINETSQARSAQALQRLEQRALATVRIQAVSRQLLDAETGQRGYLLTRRKVYLEPYDAAAVEVFQGLDWLRAHCADDALATRLVSDLHVQATARFDELAATVEAFENGQRERVLAALNSPAELQRLQTLRSLSDQLLAREQQLVRADRQTVFNTLHTGRIGVNATLVVGILALLLVLRQCAALEASQRRHTSRLQVERERLEAEAELRTADLSELARHLQTVREDEVSRLARQLSDELGTVFTTARYDVARLRRSVGSTPEVATRLDHLETSLGAGIALKRRIIEDLRPSSLSNLGLVAALEILLREFAERSGVEVHQQLEEVALCENGQITAYRLVQEALTNIAKYAQASRVTVTLRAEDANASHAKGRYAELCVIDNGHGFDTRQRKPSTHGLMGMRYRAEAVGGVLSLTSAPGQGTQLLALLPLTNADQ